jgi:hypothetical protein
MHRARLWLQKRKVHYFSVKSLLDSIGLCEIETVVNVVALGDVGHPEHSFLTFYLDFLDFYLVQLE